MAMPELRPWGRFKLVSKDPAEEKDHIYFYRTETRVGRNPQRAHVVLDMPFISGVHCIVKLDGEKENGEPIVRIQDLSRNGIYVNEVRVETTTGAEISNNATIHFTKPGLAVKGIPATVYRFEILRDGLTPQNARLRAEHDSATARLLPAAGMVTPASAKGTTAAVATTQLLTGKKHRRSEEGTIPEEMEVEVTRTMSTSEVSPSGKRRRTGDRSSLVGDEELALVAASNQLQQSNQTLRAKLSEGADRESKLKHEISQKDREIDSLKDQCQALEEGRKLAENEAALKGQRLADREQEVGRLNEAIDALRNQVDEMKAELATVRKNEADQAKTIGQLQAEREKLDMDMVTMTNQLDEAQTKVRKAEEQLKALYAEKKTLEHAIDSVQTRTQIVEEDKRGITEDQKYMKSKLASVKKLFKEGMALMARGVNMAEEENSIISAELEALQRSDQSTLYSSEQSQPAPTQENFMGDTQPEFGDDEQTLDQDAAAARAGLLAADGAVGPFAAEQSRILLHDPVSLELLDDQQQQIASFSADLSVNETPGEQTEGKSSNSESTLSGHSSSSKTPPAPPLPRPKVPAPPLALLKEAEETKGEISEDEEGVSADNEDESDDEADETVLPDDEEVEEDKENTPVAPGTSEAKSNTPQKPGQQGWLQMVVNNDDDKSEQVSASEGLFDDETQLSGGE